MVWENRGVALKPELRDGNGFYRVGEVGVRNQAGGRGFRCADGISSPRAGSQGAGSRRS